MINLSGIVKVSSFTSAECIPMTKGNSVVVSFTIIHLIATLDYEPQKIYEVLKDLSDDELLYMIREYSSGIYNILNSA